MLRIALFLLAAGWLGNLQAQPIYDLILRNGTVLDGSGNAWFHADVAVQADRIAVIGDLSQARARQSIDVNRCIIAPGFIDVHTHVDNDIFDLPQAENFIRNGVTTIVTGNCGSSVLEVGEYFRKIDQRGAAINVATLIGHNSVLRKVKGDRAGELSPEQMEQARKLVEQAMTDGAMGLSTGLIYIPGKWSDTEEIIELAKISANFNGIYASHMRSEAGAILDAIDEALRIGREAGCRVQISHFKLPRDVADRIGGTDATLGKVIAARAAGQEVWLDQYPYTASSTTITTLLPDWLLENGKDEAIKALNDPQQLDRVFESMKESHEQKRGRKDFKWVVIASCAHAPQYTGKSIYEIALIKKLRGGGDELLKADPKFSEPTMLEQYQVIVDLYLGGGAGAIYHTMDEREVAGILRHPLVAVASDAGVRKFNSGHPHPRGYGTNARVLGRYARELGIITLEDAVRKMTSMPATAFRLKDRGLLREGYVADITVFDPQRVIDQSTFEQPHQYPKGFDYVLVNGKLVLENGKPTGEMPGRSVRLAR